MRYLYKKFLSIIQLLIICSQRIYSFTNSIKLVCRILVTNHNNLILTEHLGDVVACSGLPEYLVQNNNKQIRWIVNENYSIILENNPYVDEIYKIQNLGVWVYADRVLFFLRIKQNQIFNCHFSSRKCQITKLSLRQRNYDLINADNYYNFGNLVQVFSQVGGLGVINVPPKLYLELSTFENKYYNYVVIHSSSNEESRNWTSTAWNALANHLLLSTDLNIVEIGFTKNINSSSNRYFDLTGKQNILDVYTLIENSNSFVGIDSSFAHFANALKKKSKIFLGRYRDFDSYMPYSGYFQQNENNIVFRTNDYLRELEFFEVMDFIKDIK